MWPGIEADLIPTQPGGAPSPKNRDKKKDPKVWLAGELIVRCEHQGLQSLPRQLFLKTTLRKLVLTGNALTHVPDEIQQLKELRELKLGYNQLQELPDAVCMLLQLKQLDVQHNQLESVPIGLCRLIHLSILNLDGNSLSNSVSAAGPPLCELWPAPAAEAEAAAKPSGHTAQLSGRQAAVATTERLKQGTEAILQHLLNQQDSQVMLEIKQAKLKLLQEASAQRISKMVTVADPDNLAACMEIARGAGLSTDIVNRVQQSQAATQALQQALQQAQAVDQRSTADKGGVASAGDADPEAVHQQLDAAIKQFEQLCKPGKPSGPVYQQAHAHWRALQRQQLERGWRCNSPASPGALRSGSPGALDSEYSTAKSNDSPPPRRQFLTQSERRRHELEAAGAQTYNEWVHNKQEANARERQHLHEVAKSEAKQKVTQVYSRAAKAVDNCSREKAWASKIVEAYPPGTFNRSPEQLKAIRQQYQRPPLLDHSDDEQ